MSRVPALLLRLRAVGSPRISSRGWLVGGSVALAALSLLLPSVLTTDPWGWVVWGREVSHLELHTDIEGSPAWKPLPVGFTTVFSLFGDAAPSLWLLTARAGGLLAIGLAYRLAARFGGHAAGAVAAVSVLLLPGWLYSLAHGYSEPLIAALVLWAVERHLDRAVGQAFLLVFLAALGRPEIWPFLGIYSVFVWRSRPQHRGLVAAALITLPVLWFGADWWGSGDPFHARETAQSVSAHHSRGAVLREAARLIPLPVATAATVALVVALRRRFRVVTALAGWALTWTALLVVLIESGYPSSARFFLLPAVLLCVVSGPGAVWFVCLPSRTVGTRAAIALIALAGAAPFMLARLAAEAAELPGVADRAVLERDVRALVDRPGTRRLLSHGSVALPADLGWTRGALAWELDLPLRRVEMIVMRPGRTRRAPAFVRFAAGPVGRKLMPMAFPPGTQSSAIITPRSRTPLLLFLPASSIRSAAAHGRLRARTVAQSPRWQVFAVSLSGAHRPIVSEPKRTVHGRSHR